MAEHRKEKRRIAQKRITAAWLALDAYTDSATLDKMIAAARAGRNQRKQQQRQQMPKP
jgi:hypothetical protein